jgi:hypothetical protein
MTEEKDDPAPSREDSAPPRRKVPLPMSLSELLAKYKCTYSEIPDAAWRAFDASRERYEEWLKRSE